MQCIIIGICSPPTFGFVQEEGGETFSTQEHHGWNKGEYNQQAGGGGEGEEWGQWGDERRQEADRGGEEEGEQKQGGAGGGIIRAIGETLVEIGQTTKDLVSGQHLLRGGEDEKEKRDEEPFKGI